jgi:hypothetical protein
VSGRLRRRSTKKLAGAGTALLAFGVLTALLAATSAARTGERPVITGDPIVGEVLTSSSAGDTGLYKWQSCDPNVADCADAPFNDPNWTDLTDALQDNQTYTVASSDVGHFIRVIAKGTSLGEQFVSSEPVGPVPAPPEPPAPEQGPEAQHGVQLLIQPVFGTVKVKLPGESGFTTIDNLTVIPVGTIVDTRGSRVSLTAATGDFGDTTPDDSVDFYGGLFKALQAPATNSQAVAKLIGKLSCGGKGKAARASSGGGPIAVAASKRRRRLWGSGHGSYGTAGSGGTGSVVGTTWLTVEKCSGTFFKVLDGTGIQVFDYDLNKLFSLGPGQSHFAEK